MTRVVLSTSPHVRHVAVLQSDFQPDPSVTYSFAPLGLLSLQATLRRDRPDIDCSIYDLNRRIQSGDLPLDGGIYARIAEELVRTQPDVVGFMTECDSYHHVLQICEAVKSAQPHCYVVLGGPHASAVAQPTMQKAGFIDAIVIGEGELTLVDIFDKIGTDAPVAGALTRSCDGSVVNGGPRALVANLDDLPIPAYDLYQPDLGEEIFVEVGRGCPFKCTFCSTAPYWHRKHRVKSPARIVREVKLVSDLYGSERVHFTHDLFTADRRWVLQVCEALTAAGSEVSWTCSARTDTVDRELLEKMATAGCRAIYFGIESGSQRILREIHKAVPLQESWDAVVACRRSGITPNAGFIVGFPTEDRSSFDDTLDAYEAALRAGCKPAHVFAFCPFAQSSIYPELTDIRCTGHFIDLPLGAAADGANRARVAGDRELFGAYFRPQLAGLDGLIAGADEFSPLVEATLAPSLALADLRGGIAGVYRLWAAWIHAQNSARDAPAWRRSYGSPAQFASFLLQALGEASASRQAIAAAKLLQTNLRFGETPAVTTMANHRSLVLRDVQELRLSDRVDGKSVAGLLKLDFDASPALLGDPVLDYVEEETYLVWQRLDDGAVRLLRVTEPIFRLLREVQSASVSLSDLLSRVVASELANASPGAPAEQVWGPLHEAMAQGLIELGSCQ